MAPEWHNFQEEIAAYFISLGFDAETNKATTGVRTSSDIDVYVRTKFMGQQLTWIIEAKKWKSKVSKEKVFTLRMIVNDLGADKGFIISEVGFQKGAIEAAGLTNISLLTFSQLKEMTKEFVDHNMLSTYEGRIENIYRRYLSHKKQVRRDYGLTLELGNADYSVGFVIETARDAIKRAKNKEFPISLNTSLTEQYGEQRAENVQQLINWMNLNFNVIDKKILDAEGEMQRDGSFQPKIAGPDTP
jgi:restriction system protein